MTLHNDGVDIPIEIMLRQDLTFAEKMVFGVVRAIQIQKETHLTHPSLVANKLCISVEDILDLLRSLRDKGLL
jgi:hypothetical protein